LAPGLQTHGQRVANGNSTYSFALDNAFRFIDGMTKGRAALPGRATAGRKPFFIILGGPPMIPPVGMTTIFRCIYSGLYRIVIPTGAKRSGGTCGFSGCHTIF
jgi:hypothetical protein